MLHCDTLYSKQKMWKKLHEEDFSNTGMYGVPFVNTSRIFKGTRVKGSFGQRNSGIDYSNRQMRQ